ncbi:Nucleolar GTP-binding protein 1 [Lunasporangiospora selenospora]|uniref:Nucleolar GTP-binding protein 1 n=1 Tax=Lunasporangiospora selenospora TaxID=979761 RepID=A0A9P6G249_9FUNG|nr:Nucleolar GTP-binding protein 1 [Lunasporangiospora selenospora]
MTSIYNFKKITPVPTGNDFLDIILSKTQRKTPTVIHANFAISRIRNFYMRKVKFTQENFDERLKSILDEFPKLDDIHPFYADLMNVLYDKDHYKLALGQMNTARHLIDQVGKDYVRLLKFGDSLYRCKQLKKAALGRMATIMRRQKDSLAYLEQVRQHLARLPSIDPNTRTLLVCGYPNVGKSSFMNKITRADVDVQPYAFTTKSLFVGHMDYKYLRWQVIDTPGILDHPLENRNTIEMQSITALAHLRCAVLYFIDLSERCGYSIKEQVSLFHSIKPLFANKPVMLIINKIDAMKIEDISAEDRALLDAVVDNDKVEMMGMSCYTEEGVMNVKQTACERLLQARVDAKMKGHKINDILNKIHLTQPVPRDDNPRLPFVPETAISKPKYDPKDPNRVLLERDLESLNGGAGVYSADLKKRYLLESDEWKYDVIPEIWQGKNIADFIDADIQEQLDELEREEEKLETEGHYNSDGEELNSEDEALAATAGAIREHNKLTQIESRLKTTKNRPMLPKTALKRKVSEMSDHLESIGLDSSEVRARSRGSKRARSQSQGEAIARSASMARPETSVVRDRTMSGVRNVKQKLESEKVRKLAQRTPNLFAKRGESDRAVQTKMPKHLFSNKRGNGKTDWR